MTRFVIWQIKSGERLLDAEKDYQDKSASAWQDYISKVSDIVADGIKKRAEIDPHLQRRDYWRRARLSEGPQRMQNTIMASDWLTSRAIIKMKSTGLIRLTKKTNLTLFAILMPLP